MPMTADDKININHHDWIKQLLDDPVHNDNPLRRALAATWRREQIAQDKLTLLTQQSAAAGAGYVEALLATDKKQYRRLEKISRISDHYQENMRELNEELKHQTELAKKANQAKSRFVSRISHDLRSPLNGILGFAKLLQTTAGDIMNSKQQKYVENIIMAGNHLLQLINELLDLAAIEAGKLHVQMEKVALNMVVEDCFTLVTPLTRSKNIALINELNPTQDEFIYADVMRLKQVLINLLSNAIKYNRPNGCVQLYISEPRANRLRIHVEDGGYGLDKDKLEQLFESFNRLGLENGNTEGCGIGLVIAKSLVELMDGEMGVTSELGQGSTFWFELNSAENFIKT